MKKYCIGIDYGTLSGRAVLVDAGSGEEICARVSEYCHGVMDEKLPDGSRLPPDWALQHAQDYIDVLSDTVPALLEETGTDPADVIGIGIDFTACTILPVKADGVPLCYFGEYRHDPHSYVKLWKHHGAQDYADRINEAAAARGEKWLPLYGGKISSEWALPKIWQVCEEDPAVYRAADYFVEAADWIVWTLCGKLTRCACCAGYKALWNKRDGYPSEEFLASLDPRLEKLYSTKLAGPVLPSGSKAGELTEKGAALCGLLPGTAVSAGNIDAHVCVPALKISGAGKLFAIIGTSACYMLTDEKERPIKGICGCVEDGILPGLFGYEAGQCCVGDAFAWFCDNCLPESYVREARAGGKSVHELLTELCSKAGPGESGLVALDWWNGNRSVLVDSGLSGMIVGLTLSTKPEEIYRALIEASVFGTRRILEAFTDGGIKVDSFYAAGGIARKNPFMMQMYADILDLPVYIAGSDYCGSLGSAIYAAVAAGRERGGYDTVSEAAAVMGRLDERVYLPDPGTRRVYDRLYDEYLRLHDYFGRGGNDVMKKLREKIGRAHV